MIQLDGCEWAMWLRSTGRDSRRIEREEVQLEACHARYFASLVQRQAPQLCHTSQANQLGWANSANIRCAWLWSITHGAITNLEHMRKDIAIWLELNSMIQQGSNVFGDAVAAAHTLIRSARRACQYRSETADFGS